MLHFENNQRYYSTQKVPVYSFFFFICSSDHWLLYDAFTPPPQNKSAIAPHDFVLPSLWQSGFSLPVSFVLNVCVTKWDYFCMHASVHMPLRVRLASWSYGKLRHSSVAAGKWCIWVTFEVSASACWQCSLWFLTYTAALQDVMYSVLYSF